MSQKGKLDIFSQAIMEESSAEVNEILRQMEDEHRSTVAAARASLQAEALAYKTKKISEIRVRESRRVNARMTENKQTLLLFRESCANEGFIRIRERLREFTEQPGYAEHLKRLLTRALRHLGRGAKADVFLRAEDMRFAEALEAAGGGYQLSFRPGHSHLGGLQVVCQERGIRIDLSFDSALNDLIGHFAETSGMQI